MTNPYSPQNDFFSSESIDEPSGLWASDKYERLANWLQDAHEADSLIYVKRLSGNDTGATKSKQVGIYVPKIVAQSSFPETVRIDVKNPDHLLTAVVGSHNLPEHKVRFVYYNSKFFPPGTRNEFRITQWKKSVKYTPLQDHECTGALVLFSFLPENGQKNCNSIRVWVCSSVDEEEYVESIIGEVLPGEGIHGVAQLVLGGGSLPALKKHKKIKPPESWLQQFPSGLEIITHVVDHFAKDRTLPPDKRILKRREREYVLFREIEQAHVLPKIMDGFDNVEDFISLANSTTNRRKSRAGRSLELHLECIFQEQGLDQVGTRCVTEENKKPDFLFPSCEAYHQQDYLDSRLRMLAVKTTLKDRWRQILNEAERIDSPFLFTLQEGVSENQFKEMVSEGVRLVVPKILHKKYPKPIRPELKSLEEFISETKAIYE